MKIVGRNITHYKSIGYKNISINDVIDVWSDELTNGSAIKITLKCDFCNEVFERRHSDYAKRKKTNICKKDCCPKCRIIKAKESTREKYNVSSSFELKSVREKIKNTFDEKYNGNHSKCDKVKEKNQTNILRAIWGR